MKYLQLIRYKNLLMIALMQLLLRFTFFYWQEVPLALTNGQYFLLILSTLLIAAGGYIINDIFDQGTDYENRPNKIIVGKYISENVAYNAYFVTTILGVAIGFYLSNHIQKNSFAAAFVITSGALYLYSTSLKQLPLVGNILVALLLSFSIIIVGLFDLLPTIYSENQSGIKVLFSVLMDYAIFNFCVNLIREITKDLEDVKGDDYQGMKTLPVILGINKTTKLTAVLTLIPVVLLINYCNSYFFLSNLYILAIYVFLFILAPLVYCSIKLWIAKTPAHFHHISTVLKIVILFGILSIPVLSYNITHNA